MTLESAHLAAAAYHGAMARIIECREELIPEDGDIPYWHQELVTAIGNAELAREKMPALWAEVVTRVPHGEQK